MAVAAAVFADDHPMASLIASFRLDHVRDRVNVSRLLQQVPTDDLDLKHVTYYWILAHVDQNIAVKWFHIAAVRRGPSYGDVRIEHWHQSDAGIDNLQPGSSMRRASPHWPLGQALLVRHGPFPGSEKISPEDVIRQLPELEKIYSGHAIVLRELGTKYASLKRSEDAQRCWDKSIALSPDAAVFHQVANAHRAAGNEDKWLATLETFIKDTEDTGLEHARVQVQIARHFMAKADHKKALPYAEAAAGSGAAWALLCAADCHEWLKNWDAANKWYRVAAERYQIQCFDWYFSCQQTGQMDLQGAREVTDRYVKSFAGRFPDEVSAYQAGRYYLCERQLDKSREAFRQLRSHRETDWYDLYLALLAEAIGDNVERDAALKALDALPGDGKNHLKVLAKPLRQLLTGDKKERIDLSDMEAAIKTLTAGLQADACFFVGWALDLRGQKDQASDYWKRCSNDKQVTSHLRTMANVFLRQQARANDKP
jgi:tetratricopeptide (TPR) repeat protein